MMEADTRKKQKKTPLGAKCPYCQTKIERGEWIKVCPFCGVPHHWECWRENGGCTTYGCEGTLVDRGVDPARQALPAVRGEEAQRVARPCLQCRQSYAAHLLECPHCGHPRRAELLVSYRTSVPSQVTFGLALVTVGILAFAVVSRHHLLFYAASPTAVALTLLSMLLYQRHYFCTNCRRTFTRTGALRPRKCPRCGIGFSGPPETKR